MTPEQRHRTEMLRTAMNAIFQQLKAGMIPAELSVIDSLCDEVEAFTRGDAGAQGWRRAAIATKRLLRERGEDVQAEWRDAYAELPPMDWPGNDSD